MPLVLKELASSEATNRRNAAFCVGEFCKNGGESTLKYPCLCNYIGLFTFICYYPLDHFNGIRAVVLRT